MPEVEEFEVWIAMDSEGNRDIGEDRDQALERYSDNYGGLPLRVAKVNVTMKRPEETSAEVSVVVPDGAGEVIAATA